MVLNEEGKVVGNTSYDNQCETTLSLGSHLFNLDPFIFGTRNFDGGEIQQRSGRIKGKRKIHRNKIVLLELGKQVTPEKDYVAQSHATKKRDYSHAMIDAVAKVDEVQPRREQLVVSVGIAGDLGTSVKFKH